MDSLAPKPAKRPTFTERIAKAIRQVSPASTPAAPQPSIEHISDPMERALVTPVKTIADLKAYYEIGLGGLTAKEEIVMPELALTEGHTPPLRALYEIYCIARGLRDDGTGIPLTQEEMYEAERMHLHEILIHANRGGTKTYGVGGLILKLNLDEEGYGWVHTAAEKQQTQRLNDYLKKWIVENDRSPLKKLVKGRATLKKIELTNGSEMHFVTGSTEEGVNSAHTHGFSYDEIEVANLKVVEEAMGIPQGTRHGDRILPAVVVLLSTQKHAGSTMSHFIKQAKDKPPKLNYYKWNWLETSEPCPPERRANLPPRVRCADWKRNKDLIGQLESRSKLSRTEQEELDELKYLQSKLEDNCSLVEYCQGLAIQSRGFMPIQTTKLRLFRMRAPKFRAQMHCSRPSSEGMVYPDFDEQNITEEAWWAKGAVRVGMVDWGYSDDPIAMNIACWHDGHFDIYWEQQINYKMKTPSLAELIGTLTTEMEVDEWVLGWELDQLNDYLIEAGVPADRAAKEPVEEGVKRVGEYILAEGFRCLRVHPRCELTIEEFWNYKRNPTGAQTIPRRQQDHHMDCIRAGTWRVEHGLLRSAGVGYSRRGLGRSR